MVAAKSEPSLKPHNKNLQTEKCSYTDVLKNEATNQNFNGTETAAEVFKMKFHPKNTFAQAATEILCSFNLNY